MRIMRHKQRIFRLLRGDDLGLLLAELELLAPEQVLNPLFSGICRAEEHIRWQAIIAMGATVARLADADMEAARVVMRRLMWSLNDESGGIGWGAAESMAEIMAIHEGLAGEYGHMQVAYMREDGNYQELEAMQQGVIWGVGRLTLARPGLMKKWRAALYLPPYLQSRDGAVRGLAAWALGLLKARQAGPMINRLVGDQQEVRLFVDRQLKKTTVDELAQGALALLS
ncbi:MAG: HEAT repeat domain-containing protein [Desulfobacterales bacterium]|nr:HEAT repeat domain-containing protein [Desulfobacterales bacterium]